MEKDSLTNAQFTSSSDEEGESTLKAKLNTKRLVLNKSVTNSSDSKIVRDEIHISDNKTFCVEKSSNAYILDTDMGNSVSQIEQLCEAERIQMSVDCKTNQEDVLGSKLSDDDSAKKTQRKKKRKPNKRNINLPAEVDGDKTLMKYWVKRYRLFSKFDQGIKLDRGKKTFLYSY